MNLCDWCGSTMTVISETCDRRGKLYFAQCDRLDCDRSGPVKESKVEAVDSWNSVSSAPYD